MGKHLHKNIAHQICTVISVRLVVVVVVVVVIVVVIIAKTTIDIFRFSLNLNGEMFMFHTFKQKIVLNARKKRRKKIFVILNCVLTIKIIDCFCLVWVCIDWKKKYIMLIWSEKFEIEKRPANDRDNSNELKNWGRENKIDRERETEWATDRQRESVKRI